MKERGVEKKMTMDKSRELCHSAWCPDRQSYTGRSQSLPETYFRTNTCSLSKGKGGRQGVEKKRQLIKEEECAIQHGAHRWAIIYTLITIST